MQEHMLRYKLYHLKGLSRSNGKWQFLTYNVTASRRLQPNPLLKQKEVRGCDNTHQTVHQFIEDFTLS